MHPPFEPRIQRFDSSVRDFVRPSACQQRCLDAGREIPRRALAAASPASGSGGSPLSSPPAWRSSDYLLTGNPVDDTKLASSRLYRRFQALERLAEDDREAIIKVIDAIVIKHQTRQMVEEIES